MYKPKPGKSFADTQPDMIKEWSDKNEYSPYDYAPYSNKKVLWVCLIHGDYYQMISHRSLGQGCCRCGRNRSSKKLSTPKPFHSLGDLYPNLLKEYSPKNTRNPYSLNPGNKYKAIWVCKEGHEWVASIASRTGGKRSGCKKCGSISSAKLRSLPTPFHSFADLYPDLLKEWSRENEVNPYSISVGASSCGPIKWVCKDCNYGWSTYLKERTGSHKTGCPRCNKANPSTAEQNLRSSLVHLGTLTDQYKIGKWSIDIYFPESKTVVEYDGSAWHHKPENYERDRRKSLDLLSQGYRVIRVRTCSSKYKLDTLGIEHGNYFEVFCEEPKDSVPKRELIDSLTDLLSMV